MPGHTFSSADQVYSLARMRGQNGYVLHWSGRPEYPEQVFCSVRREQPVGEERRRRKEEPEPSKIAASVFCARKTGRGSEREAAIDAVFIVVHPHVARYLAAIGTSLLASKRKDGLLPKRRRERKE